MSEIEKIKSARQVLESIEENLIRAISLRAEADSLEDDALNSAVDQFGEEGGNNFFDLARQKVDLLYSVASEMDDDEVDGDDKPKAKRDKGESVYGVKVAGSRIDEANELVAAAKKEGANAELPDDYNPYEGDRGKNAWRPKVYAAAFAEARAELNKVLEASKAETEAAMNAEAEAEKKAAEEAAAKAAAEEAEAEKAAAKEAEAAAAREEAARAAEEKKPTPADLSDPFNFDDSDLPSFLVDKD